MAHFLRGKQAGIQNDLSGGLGPDLFCIDDVSSTNRSKHTLQAKRLTTLQTYPVRTIWHKLSDQRRSLRSGPIPPLSWNKRYTIWEWANLRVWPATSLRHFCSSPEGFLQDPTILRRQARQRRFQK